MQRARAAAIKHFHMQIFSRFFFMNIWVYTHQIPLMMFWKCSYTSGCLDSYSCFSVHLLMWCVCYLREELQCHDHNMNAHEFWLLTSYVFLLKFILLKFLEYPLQVIDKELTTDIHNQCMKFQWINETLLPLTVNLLPAKTGLLYIHFSIFANVMLLPSHCCQSRCCTVYDWNSISVERGS